MARANRSRHKHKHTHTQTPTEAEVFCQQMMATFPRVSRMKKPLTYEEYRMLLKKHSV